MASVRAVMGIDSSTQSTKVEWRDIETGAPLAATRAAHPATTPPRSEQDPERWWAALADATSAAPERMRAGTTAMAVGGQQHGMVVLDAQDRVIRPAKLWNDTESAPDAAALVDALGAPTWADACGSVPVAAFTITKLAWLARCEPHHFDRVNRVLLPHDWINLRLTGEASTDRGDASGTGYWSPTQNRYRTDLLAGVSASTDAEAWAARLPTVLGPLELAGELIGPARDDLGVSARSVIVAAGTGDNMAAALGVALAPGDVAVSLGTSGTVFAVSATPTTDASAAVAGFADATGHFLPLVCTLNATQVTDTFARLLGVDLATLDAMAATAPPGAGGVIVVPYLNGERTPNRPDATGTLAGLRTDATREQLARAAYEGVICGLLDGLDAIRNAGVDVSGRLVLVGGGARSPRYQQVLADLAQRPVTIPDADELVAAGACVQAAAVASGAPLLDVARTWGLGSGTTIDPDPAVPPDLVADVRDRYAATRG